VINSRIEDWDSVIKIWNHIFNNDLIAAADEHNIMAIESPGQSRMDREHMVEVMFEEIGVRGFYLANSCVMSLFSNGRTSGIVVESGFRATHIVPIFEGYMLPHASIKFDVGGQDITNYLV
jgi:actin-related protein